MRITKVGKITRSGERHQEPIEIKSAFTVKYYLEIHRRYCHVQEMQLWKRRQKEID